MCSTVLFSQESKLKFHSISIAPLNYYFDSDLDGAVNSIDIALKKGKHVYKVFGLAGGETQMITIGSATVTRSFFEVDVMYGREFKANKWLYFDFYGGLGYFERIVSTPERIPGSGTGGLFQTYDYTYNIDRTSTIGFPIQSKIRYKVGNRFSLGLQLHANFNSIKSSYSIGPFVQWYFGKMKKTKPKAESNSN